MGRLGVSESTVGECGNARDNQNDGDDLRAVHYHNLKSGAFIGFLLSLPPTDVALSSPVDTRIGMLPIESIGMVNIGAKSQGCKTGTVTDGRTAAILQDESACL